MDLTARAEDGFGVVAVAAFDQEAQADLPAQPDATAVGLREVDLAQDVAREEAFDVAREGVRQSALDPQVDRVAQGVFDDRDPAALARVEVEPGAIELVAEQDADRVLREQEVDAGRDVALALAELAVAAPAGPPRPGCSRTALRASRRLAR